MKTATTKISKREDEYRVRLFLDGEYQAGSDYFTEDKEDANVTAAAMIKHYQENAETIDAYNATAENNEKWKYH